VNEPTPPARPMGQVLTDLAVADPDHPAITFDGVTTTRRELESRANQWARHLAALGVVGDDLVTIALPNGVDFYATCFAAWKLGATPQPVSWQLPQWERDQIVELAGSPVVFGAEEGTHPGRVCLPLGSEPPSDLDDGPLPVAVATSWKAMTSGGSTGRPKLIVAQEPSVWTAERNRLGMHPGQTQLVAGPLYHNGPFLSMYGALLGQHLIVLPRFDPHAALQMITDHGIGFLQLVPTMMQRMLRQYETEPERYDLTSIERLWHLAAPCPPWLKQAWIDLIGPEKVFELYAGTEAVAGTVISGTEWLEHPGSVGRAVGGELRVFDDRGQPAPPGEIGKVYMRRPPDAGPSYRYIGAESDALPDGWESLGDMGWLDEDGYLFLADRRTDLILAGGANIYPAEVEAAINEHPAVASCAVVGLPDPDLGQRVHAVVQAEDLDEIELAAYLSDRLVRYKVPRSFRFVDHALRDDAGKVRRSAVREDEVARLAGTA